MRMTLIALTLLAAACTTKAGGPPDIVVDRTACSHCGMLISEPIYAAAYQAAGHEARVFDDIGCLLKSAQAESGALTYWFHDAHDRSWIDGSAAVFVASPAIRTPMGGGVIAFRDRAAAEQLAAGEHGGDIIPSLTDLLARPNGGR